MKKQLRLSLISSAVLLAATTACFAGSYKGENYKGEAMPPCPTPLMIKDGFYLGAQLGYESYRVRATRNYSDGIESFSSNPALSAVGWVGGLFGGYGQYINDMYYLGGELLVNTSGAENSTTVSDTYAGLTDSVNHKFEVGTSYGISLLPGLRINDASLLYVRLGYNEARFKGRDSVTVDSVNVFSTSKSKWRGGFIYGLGLESAFYQNWSVRTEFNHTNYGSFTNDVSGVKYSPSDNQFMVGVNYHFA